MDSQQGKGASGELGERKGYSGGVGGYDVGATSPNPPSLIPGCEDDLIAKAAELRLELRRNGGHRGKVDTKVLVWLENYERHQIHFSDLGRELRPTQFCICYYLRKILRKFFKVMDEANLLKESASSLSVFNDRKRLPVGLPLQTLAGDLAPRVLNKIWECLTDPMVGRIGLYGLGGVGKTTIMKNITNQLASTEIFDKIIWVTLTKNAIYERLRDDIAKHLNNNFLQASSNLKNVSNCLFVLDDMWEHIPLSELAIPEPTRDNGCKVVITTRFLHICESMETDEQIYLARLSEEEAWEFFASRSGHPILGSEVKDVAKEIVHKCSGLPITINTVARAMRDETNTAAWRLVWEELQNREIENKGEDEVTSLLRLGYDRLKNNRSRECFLYCAIFPEGYRMETKELLEYWLAEGIIYSEMGIIASMDEGRDIIRELKDADMLEVFVEGGNEWFKMHNSFRNLAISIMEVRPSVHIESGKGLVDFPPLGLRPYSEATKISLIRNQIEILEVRLTEEGRIFRRTSLSTLLLRDNPLSECQYPFFFQMPDLQILDMSYSGITELPLSIDILTELRVLFLQYCTNLKRIPSLAKLKKLEVLNLCGTLIKELPEGLESLFSLRSLNLSNTVRLQSIKGGVLSSLSNLEELQLERSRLCQMETQTVANAFKEIRSLKKLAILTLSGVGFEDHLDTILYLQGHSLRIFSVNIYGAGEDYIEDV